MQISTHALTWSATKSASLHHLLALYFNSRAHVERDAKQTETLMLSATFQLTRSRGARLPHVIAFIIVTFYFNSRAHVERDK